MFHDIFTIPVCLICFTICLFISPDLDGNRGTSTIITKMCPERPTKGPETQIRSHRLTFSSKYRLP
jgi:hypothetical protein